MKTGKIKKNNSNTHTHIEEMHTNKGHQWCYSTFHIALKKKQKKTGETGKKKYCTTH